MYRSPLADIAEGVVPKRANAKPIVAWADYLRVLWQERECFVCGRLGRCRHRQPEAESVAAYEACVGTAESELRHGDWGARAKWEAAKARIGREVVSRKRLRGE